MITHLLRIWLYFGWLIAMILVGHDWFITGTIIGALWLATWIIVLTTDRGGDNWMEEI